MKFHELDAPDRWIAALEDQRLALRAGVLMVLTDFVDPPVAALAPALRMVDQHGWDGAFEFPHLITKLPHTEDSFAWLVARLHSFAPLAGKQNELWHLSGWFAGAPVEWLGREIDGFAETLMASLKPGGGTVRSKATGFRSPGASFDKATKRLALHGLTNEALRTRTNHLLDRCPVQDSFPHAEVDELELIAKTLAARGECLREAAGEWLDIEDSSADGEIERNQYRAGFALMLLTEGRVKVPLDPLLNLLSIDWDWMNEWYAKALSASADAMSVSELLNVYPMLEWFERLYSGGVIEDCWHRENEAEVLQAARNEDADDLRVILASCLVLHGSPEARQYARSVADERPADPERRRIIELETIREVVGGVDTPATRAFLSDMEREIRRDRDRFRVLDRGGPPLPFMKSEGNDPTVKLVTAVGTGPLIGRNDPCPCGSGKKYKKCCLE